MLFSIRISTRDEMDYARGLGVFSDGNRFPLALLFMTLLALFSELKPLRYGILRICIANSLTEASNYAMCFIAVSPVVRLHRRLAHSCYEIR